MLENLAQGAVKADAVEKIGRIEDQYLSFISLERNLFSLGLPDVYTRLNDPTAKDTDIENCVETIVDGLFCVFVTLGVLPIMKCPPGGAAEHICSALDERIRTALKHRNNLFTESASGLLSSLIRTQLIVFDRNFDLSAALQHTWSYKPLVQVHFVVHSVFEGFEGRSGFAFESCHCRKDIRRERLGFVRRFNQSIRG